MSRILVVDDEPAIGWSLRELLVEEGHEVTVAADVATAVEAAGRERPDAILLDVRLGSADGIAAVPELRAAAGPVPIVVMTAFGDLATAVRAIQAGAVDFLLKPFDLEWVVKVLRRVVAARPADEAGEAVAAAMKAWSTAARRERSALPEPDLHHRAVQLVEGTLLREALAHTGGNRTAAAKLLGLDRATLRTKLRSLGIDD
ncbi:MAG: Transcriptional regulatory protein ZraR [Planctomycetota bacterium]|jgi:DNA-binding NtrC family response regulator